MPTRRLLFLGDVCSSAGRDALKQALPGMRRWTQAEFVIANVENAAAGYGVNRRYAEELLAAGVDCMTTGDHAFDRKEAWPLYDEEPRLLRAANFPEGVPGRGWTMLEKDGFRVGVVNLLGRVFMKPLDCPFRGIGPILDDVLRHTPVVVVDFHAEATAEKQAMGWYLDGKVSALLGTHTHVQTADERVLPGGTAYITDVGMCGAFDSVLGMRTSDSLRRLLDGLPVRLHPAKDDRRLSGVVVEVDEETGRARSIERLQVTVGAEPGEPGVAGEEEP